MRSLLTSHFLFKAETSLFLFQNRRSIVQFPYHNMADECLAVLKGMVGRAAAFCAFLDLKYVFIYSNDLCGRFLYYDPRVCLTYAYVNGLTVFIELSDLVFDMINVIHSLLAV